MRMKKTIAACAVIGAILATGYYVRRQKYVAQTHKISEGVYVFCAGGMNTMAVIADDGVILVDTMRNGWWGEALEVALREVTDKPVTTIINTSSHLPHSGNNYRFAKDGVVVIAHERTRSRLQGRENFQGESARHLPQTTFRDRLTVTRGKERIDLYHFGAANTDGDAWVVFPSRRVMHVGDLVKIDEMLEITPADGGSGVSYAATMGRAIATIKEVDLVVAGHIRDTNVRPTLSWSELGEYQGKAGVILDAVRKAMRSADGVDAVISHVHASAQFSGYKTEDVTAAVRAIHAELSAAPQGSRRPGRAELLPLALVLGPPQQRAIYE
jgi:glyoxylase-like metal-dependent hydrolase (beta-lactamase superfamily II)